MSKYISIINKKDVFSIIQPDNWKRHELPNIPFSDVKQRCNHQLMFIAASGICNDINFRGKVGGFDLVYWLPMAGMSKMDRLDIVSIDDNIAGIKKVPKNKFSSFHHMTESELNNKYSEIKNVFRSRLINCLTNIAISNY